jgi:hypothetical protein
LLSLLSRPVPALAPVNAQAYLNRVTQNKAGHAEKARHLVAVAIMQGQEGIAYGESTGE